MLSLLSRATVVVTLIKIIEASCHYATDPGWYATSKYHYRLAVCPEGSADIVLSTITFPSQYIIESSPSECRPVDNGSLECTSSGGFLSFDLITPGNSNGDPSVMVSVDKEQCQFTTSCSVAGGSKHKSKDKAMLSLGPFGTYPRAAAIGGLCAVCCVVLFGAILVYKRARMYSSKSTEDPPRRRNMWQLICGRTHRETGSRFKKSTVNTTKKQPARALSTKRIRDLEQGNANIDGTNFNNLSLGEVSVNELGSGMKNIPKSSIITDHKNVKKPSSTVDKSVRASVRREPKTKSKEREAQTSDIPSRSEAFDSSLAHSVSTDKSKNKNPVSDAERAANKRLKMEITHHSTINEGRPRNSKDDAKHQRHNHDPKRRHTTKEDGKKHRLTTVESQDKVSARHKGGKSSEAHDSDDVPLKVHRSKTNATKSRRTERRKSLDNQDDTPLGLMQRGKTLTVANNSITKLPSAPPQNEDNLPLLHPSLIKVRATRDYAHPRFNRNSIPANDSPEKELPDGQKVVDMYKDN